MRILACTLLVAAAPAFAQDIVVGQSAPLTGGNAELGNDIRNGALAYFKKVNDAGGLPQGKLKLVTLDDRQRHQAVGRREHQEAGERPGRGGAVRLCVVHAQASRRCRP